MKYLQLKNGQYIAENAICFVGIEHGEIWVQYIDEGRTNKVAAESAEPCSLESVIVALRRELAEGG